MTMKINAKIKKTVSLSLVTTLLLACNNTPKALAEKAEPPSAQTASANIINQVESFAKLTQPKVTGPLIKATDTVHYLNRSIQDEVFYFVMPDRFANGTTENDNGSKTILASQGGFDNTDKGMFHGGDINGLQGKLPYLKELGVTSIWLTPILRNQALQDGSSGYHGYWVLDFTEIDPHLGSNDDLKTLIAAAHKENIKIFFDIITNHTADVIKYEECHGKDGLQWLAKADNGSKNCPFKSRAQLANGDTYKTIIPAGRENLKFPEWLNAPKYYHNQGDSFWEGESSVYGDFNGLDDVNTDDPEVVTGMIDIFKNIITEFKPDGFRIDTVKHANIEFWSTFSPALVKHAKNEGIPEFFMFGEVYSGNPSELSQYTTTGNMQSVLDFGLTFTIHDVVAKQEGTNKLAELFAQDHKYLDSDSNANQLLNFTGNHDMGRFAHILKTSEHNYNEFEIIQRNLLGHAMVYFMRGVPIIYYGDEQGFVGDGGDQASRQDMMPSFVDSYNDDDLLASQATTADDNFDTNHPFYQKFAEYAHIYLKYPALRYGEHKTLYSQKTPGIFALSRTMTTDNVEHLVVFNTHNSSQLASFKVEKSHYIKLYEGAGRQHKLEVKQGEVIVEIPALSFTIYQSK
jgi:glycosidase